MLDDKTYSFNYGEWANVESDYKNLLEKAEKINAELPSEYKDAFFQQVYLVIIQAFFQVFFCFGMLLQMKISFGYNIMHIRPFLLTSL